VLHKIVLLRCATQNCVVKVCYTKSLKYVEHFSKKTVHIAQDDVTLEKQLKLQSIKLIRWAES